MVAGWAMLAALTSTNTPVWVDLERTTLAKDTQVVVESSQTVENSPRARIVWRGKTVLTIQPDGGLAKLTEAAPEAGLPPNMTSSSWVYVPKLQGEQSKGVVMIFGHAFASDPGSISVLKLSADSAPKFIYRNDTFLVTSVREHVGKLQIVGKQSLSQPTGVCATTYDPFSVVTTRADGALAYASTLSRKYNLSNYLWAGARAREDIRVNTCAHPVRLMPRE
jgi:hypothetical protein